MTIGNYAFEGCTGLQEIVIPEGTLTLGYEAFTGCSGLKSAVLADSITKMGGGVFRNCARLRTVNYPVSLMEAGSGNFEGCSALLRMVVPEGVSALPGNAFANGTGIVRVDLPQSLKTIGNSAFEGMSSLTELILPDDIYEIPNYAFENDQKMERIWVGPNVVTVGYGAFSGCSKEVLVIHGEAGSYIESWAAENGYAFSSEKFAFEDLPLSGRVILEDGTGVPGIAVQLYDVSGLKSVYTGQTGEDGTWTYEEAKSGTVYKVSYDHPDYTFSSRSLEILMESGTSFPDVTAQRMYEELEESPAEDFTWEVVDGSTVRITGYTGSAQTVVIPEYLEGKTVETLGNGVFERNTVLEHVVFPAQMKTIENDAFENCTKLETVRFRGPVETIRAYAFSGCTSLTAVTLPEGLREIGYEAFCRTGLTEVVLPDSVKTLGGRAFAGCSSLGSFGYPLLLESAGSDIFSDVPRLTRIEVPEGVTSLPGNVFGGCTYLQEVQLPSTLEVIGSSAFEGCTGLKAIALPENLDRIENYAFENCDALKAVELPEKLTSLGYESFSHCDSLESVVLPESLTQIGGRAFAEAPMLESINYPVGVTEAGSGIFSGDTRLTKMTVPEGITLLPANIFASANCLVQIELPGTLEEIGQSAFEGCIGLPSITLPDSLVKLGNSSFEGCTGLQEIVFPENLEFIGNYALQNCDSLKTVTLPGKVSELGYEAISNCDIRESVVLPDALSKIGGRALAGNPRLTSVNYPVGLTEAGSGIFAGDTSLRTLVVPDGVTSLPNSIFEGCSFLRRLYLPSTLRTIGNSALEGCKGLPSLTIPDQTASMGNYALSGCEGLTALTIPGSVATLSYEAAAYCVNLEQVTLCDGILEIRNRAFAGDTKLKEIYIPSSVVTFGDDIFEGCSNVVIYCIENSAAAIYAIDHNIPVRFYSGEDDAATILKQNESYYQMTVSSAVSNGYISGKVRYSVKDEVYPELSDMDLKVKFPVGVTLIENTVRLNGIVNADYTYEDGALIIKTDGQEGTLDFCLVPETSKEYYSYAALEYTRSGKPATCVIDTVTEEIPVMTIMASETVSSPKVEVYGAAPASAQVTFYVDGVEAGTAYSLKDGSYRGSVTLSDPIDGLVYEVAAAAYDGAGNRYEVSTDVWYSNDEPLLKQFMMYYNNHQESKKDLLTAGGDVVSYNPAYPFHFLIDFDNGEAVDTVYVKSLKGGIAKYIEAHKDPATGKYVADGYFGGDANYVPGTLSVEYNIEKPNVDREKAYQVIKSGVKKVYKDVIDTADVKTETTTDGGEQMVVELQNFLDHKLTKLSAKSLDKLSETDFGVVYDALDVVTYIFDEHSDKYAIKVIKNFEANPGEGGSDLLVMIGDLTSNQGMEYILTGFTGDEFFAKGMGKFGKVLKTAGKVWGTVNDVNDLKEKILSSNYSESEKAQLLREVETYEACQIAFQVASLAAGFAVAGAAPEIYIAYLIGQYVLEKYFEEWMQSLEDGKCKFRWVVDPSGYVYEGVEANRLEGVKATAYYMDDGGNPVLWDAENYSQTNPLFTGEDGTYAWDVPEGKWLVEFEKEGYETIRTDWYDVPPVQTEINAGMVAIAEPELVRAAFYESYAELVYSQYVDVSSLEGMMLTDGSEMNIPYTLQYEAQTGTDGAAYAKSFQAVYDGYTLQTGTDAVASIPAVRSYNGKSSTAQVLPFTEEKPLALSLPDEGSLKAGETVRLKGTITNYTGSDTLTAVSSLGGVIAVAQLIQPDENGNFEIHLEGISSGDAVLTVSVDNSDVKAEVTLHAGVEGNLEPLEDDPQLVTVLTLPEEDSIFTGQTEVDYDGNVHTLTAQEIEHTKVVCMVLDPNGQEMQGGAVNPGVYTVKAVYEPENENYQIAGQTVFTKQLTIRNTAQEQLDAIAGVKNAEELSLDDKAAVEAARAAYEALSDAEKLLVPEEDLLKLTAAEEKIAALEAEEKAAAEKAAAEKAAAEKAAAEKAAAEKAAAEKAAAEKAAAEKAAAEKAAAEKAAAEKAAAEKAAAEKAAAEKAAAEKAAAEKAAAEKAAAEKAAAEKAAADKAAAEAGTKVIAALREAENMTIDDKASVEAARKAYDALTVDQKKLVSATDLEKLTNAEAKIKALEAKAAQEGDPNDPSSVAGTNAAVTELSNSADPVGSSFAAIQLQSTKQTKSSITLKWNKVKGASGYILYGNRYGKKYKYQRMTEDGQLTKNTITVKKLADGTKLKKGTPYKFIVVAYKTVKGTQQVIAKSKAVYVATTGGKVTNVKKVTAKSGKKTVKKLSLKRKKKATLKATVTRQSKKLKLASYRKIRYESSNKKIATVTAKGKVTAKKKGSCYIYVYSQSGVYAKIKLTVK